MWYFGQLLKGSPQPGKGNFEKRRGTPPAAAIAKTDRGRAQELGKKGVSCPGKGASRRVPPEELPRDRGLERTSEKKKETRERHATAIFRGTGSIASGAK